MTVNEVHKIATKYNMKISTSKTRTTEICGKTYKRVKTETEGKIIEQVSNFSFPGNLIENEKKDIIIKL
jgi:hypothetical protein